MRARSPICSGNLRTASKTEVAEGFVRTKAMVAVQLAEDGTVQVYGWGETDLMSAIGTLHMGIHRLARDDLEVF